MQTDNSKASLAALARRTAEIYQRHAARFDRERPKGMHERVWIDRFIDLLAPGEAVLDLGCGAGDPIACYIKGRGFRVTGIDISPAMITLARQRDPEGDWRRDDIRTLALAEQYGGIIGWNSFFHLTMAEQREALPKIAAHLKPGGALLLTVGHDAGEVTGRVGGEPVYHASLAPAEYRRVLAGLDIAILRFVAEDPDCDFQTVLLARKARA